MKYSSINLMLPTYKRSKTSLPLFITSAIMQAADPTRLHFCFCVNDNDAETLAYLAQLDISQMGSLQIVKESLMQPDLSQYFNMMYEQSAQRDDDGCLVSMLGDDMEFVTPNWDSILLDKVNETKGVGVYWGDDDYIAHDGCCVNMFVARPYVRATRKPFMCPNYQADMIDVIWTMVGQITGTARYIEELVIRHNHSTRVPVEQYDETFKRLRPLQRNASTRKNIAIAKNYATIIAGNLIDEGMGAWHD